MTSPAHSAARASARQLRAALVGSSPAALGSACPSPSREASRAVCADLSRPSWPRGGAGRPEPIRLSRRSSRLTPFDISWLTAVRIPRSSDRRPLDFWRRLTALQLTSENQDQEKMIRVSSELSDQQRQSTEVGMRTMVMNDLRSE